MNYKKYQFDKFNIHLIKTDKFNTTTISINFLDDIKKSDITIRRFLFNTLIKSTKKYNTSRLFEIKLEDLYNLSVSESTIKTGNIIASYLDFKFLDTKYTGNEFIKNIIDLINEILFNPNVENNKFDINSFNNVKTKLESSINSKQEDIAKYSILRSYELLDENDPISFSLIGNIEDLNKITPSNLYDYYNYVINNNKIEIFIIGNINDDIINYFNTFNIGCKKEIKPYITYKKKPEIKGFMEDMDTTQSRLSIVLKAKNLTLYERRYVLPLYTNILAGSSNSRLFTNVREKNSLAYSIGGFNNSANSIITIYAGINKDNYNKVLDLINNELKLDNLTSDEINISKNAIISSLDNVFDNSGSIINYYFSKEVFKSDDIKKRISKYNNVSKEDILKLSKKINIAVVYFLRGINE